MWMLQLNRCRYMCVECTFLQVSLNWTLTWSKNEPHGLSCTDTSQCPGPLPLCSRFRHIRPHHGCYACRRRRMHTLTQEVEITKSSARSNTKGHLWALVTTYGFTLSAYTNPQSHTYCVCGRKWFQSSSLTAIYSYPRKYMPTWCSCVRMLRQYAWKLGCWSWQMAHGWLLPCPPELGGGIVTLYEWNITAIKPPASL